MITGIRAQKLMIEVLARLAPYLPPGIEVVAGSRGKWLTLRRRPEDERNVGPVAVTARPDGRLASVAHEVTLSRGLGAWIPLLPTGLQCRLAVQDAVETALAVAYGSIVLDFDVKAEAVGDSILVSYRPQGGGERDRVNLDPIPLGSFAAHESGGS